MIKNAQWDTFSATTPCFADSPRATNRIPRPAIEALEA
jgi:hypothetical protein